MDADVVERIDVATRDRAFEFRSLGERDHRRARFQVRYVFRTGRGEIERGAACRNAVALPKIRGHVFAKTLAIRIRYGGRL